MILKDINPLLYNDELDKKEDDDSMMIRKCIKDIIFILIIHVMKRIRKRRKSNKK